MNTTKAVRRILIVDDEPNVRLVFRTALASPGYLLGTAEDGESALELIEETPFDLVLLDLQMPGRGGMEVLEELRARGMNVPVVMITAHGKIPDVVRAMRLGAIDFVSKPLTPDTLRESVADVLERHGDERAPAPTPSAARDSGPVTIGSQYQLQLNRGKRAINLRAFDEAEVFLKQAIALESGSAEAHNLMGVVHESRNRHDDAYRSYRAALKVDRNYEPARHNMIRYYERFTFGRSDVPLDTGLD